MWCQMGNVITSGYKVGICDRKCSQARKSLCVSKNTWKFPEAKFTDDDPLARVEIGPVWIATYGMDEYPLRYVSERK